MATDFLSEAVVEARDGAATETANNFVFLSKLSRLPKVSHCGFSCPQRISLPCSEISSYCVCSVSFMTSFSTSIETVPLEK